MPRVTAHLHRRTLPLVAVALLAVAGIALARVPNERGAGSAQAAVTAAADIDLARAQAALARMPLADRVSQLITTSVPGSIVLRPLDVKVLRKARFGGVVLFADNYATMPGLLRFTRAVQIADLDGDATRPRAFVAIDQEGGVVKRIADAPPTRSAPQLGSTNRPAITRAQGRITGQALRALGVQVDYAPVGDLDLGPAHVMRERSFGSDPAKVGEQVAAFVTGLQGAGVAAAVKHYPGFGAASLNSDDGLATITAPSTQLDRGLAPFQAAVDAGVDMVMVSHARYTALDRLRPASASPSLYRRLREDLGFNGVAVTDSLHAVGFGAATHTTVPVGCVRVIVAGADVALLTGSLKDALDCRAQLLVAVRSGALSNTRIDEAALRVLTLKARLGLLPTVD